VAKDFLQISDMEEKLWRVFERGGRAIDEVLESEGLATEENKQLALHTYRFHMPAIELYEGARAMLVRLRQNGKRIGLITDGRPEGQRAKIHALRLEPLVDEIIVTDELGGIEFRKPNEIAFRLMQERLGIPFESMIYVGDNLRKDGIAPEALGMKFCHHLAPDGLYVGR
jgi:putative hydrolase of the HAD superfamily